MRKSLLLIAAAMVVLCFAQCTKQRPSNPYMGKKTGNITFTASPSGGDSKNHFTDPMTGGLNFTWEAGDKLYVYCSSDGNFESNGYYSGCIDIVSGVDKKEATFDGTVTYNYIQGAKFRFYYFGHSLNLVDDSEIEGTDISTTADFSSQNGNNETVSDKLIAMLECDIDPFKPISDYGGTLEVQFAIAKVAFKGFNESDAMTVAGLPYTKVKVNGRGVVSYVEGITSSLGEQAYTSTPGEFSEPYYIVFMPDTEKTKYQFYDQHGNSGKLKIEDGIDIGTFYSKKLSLGDPIEIEAGKEDVILGQGGNQGDGQ